MRTLFLAAVVALGSLSMSQSASSMPAGPLAIQSENPIETVAYVCRRVRVCGPHGCGWRRRCWETGRRWGGDGGGYRTYKFADACATAATVNVRATGAW